MADDLFTASQDPDGIDITYDPFPRPVPKQPGLPWRWYLFQTAHKYTAFMVRVYARQGDSITFAILNRTTGEDISKQITTNLFDVRNIYAWSPSTAQLVTDPKAASNCGFLLITDEFMTANGFSQAQHDASTGGKWPEGAPDDLTTAIRKSLQSEALSNTLTHSERASLATVLDLIRERS